MLVGVLVWCENGRICIFVMNRGKIYNNTQKKVISRAKEIHTRTEGERERERESACVCVCEDECMSSTRLEGILDRNHEVA